MKDMPERRATPRFEIFAQASVVSGGEMYLLSVLNISAAGAFLEGRPKEYPDLRVGVEIDLALSATAADMSDDEVTNIQCRGRVARTVLGTAATPGGFGITIEPLSDADRNELEALLGRLADTPPELRAARLG
jgi:hypothetical protein